MTPAQVNFCLNNIRGKRGLDVKIEYRVYTPPLWHDGPVVLVDVEPLETDTEPLLYMPLSGVYIDPKYVAAIVELFQETIVNRIG